MNDPEIKSMIVISIHALRKESDATLAAYQITLNISIHALRKESDLGVARVVGACGISIHALRKESDRRDRRDPPIRVDFNPRSP